MKNKGLFSTLFIESIRSQVKLDDAGTGRMATLSHDWKEREAASEKSLWESFIKQGLAYLEFVPQESDKSGVYRLFEDYGYSNCVSVLFLAPPDSDLDDSMVGRFWPGKLIAELKRRKLNWGILTDGAAWRLYSTKSSRPYEDYVELDLEGVLESSDESEYALFERFFHRDSFVPEVPDDEEETEQAKAEGVYKCRLDRDREASEKVLEEKVKTPFLSQVDEVLQYLCNGFIIDTPRRGEEYTEEERKEIFESAVNLIYRCLFLFYAESRSLLPSDTDKTSAYEKHSIKTLCREAHKFQWGTRKDTDQYDLWKHLKGLTNAVNFGDPEYGIKGYDGGLFDDEEEKFLGEHKLRNDFLARALYLLFYVEPYSINPKDEYEIPYEDLEVRHLGELYENILEYTVLLAPADRIRRRSKKGVEILLASETKKQQGDTVINKGDVYFGESALERKQTGSYYTPETLVRFLNAKVIVEPLRERFNEDYRERFKDLLEQTSSGYDESTKRGAWRSAVSLIEQFAHKEVLNFKVCDPAMGSGHFLVDASNQISGLIVDLLSEISNIKGESGSILSRPNDWRRLVTRHCLYGFDLNPLAVNLAKLSLWLNCFAQNHKLTFLDHHLRCGNSLIGIRSINQLKTPPERKKDTKKESKAQKLPFEDFSKTLSDATKVISEISAMDEDDTDRQKEIFERANIIARKTLSPLADLYTAYLMDGSIKEDDYINLLSQLAKGNNHSQINNENLQKIIEQVDQHSNRHQFSHWPLEFPDVFGPDAVGGFSATVGNPPWDTVLPNSQEFFSVYDPDFRTYKKKQAKQVAKVLMKNNPAIAKKWEDYGNRFTQQITYFKEPINFASIGKIHINTYKLFLEKLFSLLRIGGRMGIVVPSGIYTDQGCQPLREMFFNRSQVEFIYCFENRWPTVFTAVDGRFKFVTFCTQKGGETDRFKSAFMEHDPARLPFIDTIAMQLTFKQVKKLSPDTLSIMEFDNQREINIAAAIYQDNPLLGNYLKDNWNTVFQDEFNITHDSELFLAEDECLGTDDVTPLWEGKQIWLLTSEFAAPTRWMLQSNTKIKPTTQKTRVVYRSVASNTNERTLIPSIIPANFPTGNSVDACPLPPSVAIKVAVIMGSFVIDWILRKKVTTNLNKFITAQLPILNEIKDSKAPRVFDLLLAMGSRLICTNSDFSEIWNDCYSEKWNDPEFWYPFSIPTDNYGQIHEQEIRQRLRDEAGKLTPEWGLHCGVHNRLPDQRDTGDRAQLRAEIDAYVAHLYGLSQDDFAYILDTFPVLKRKEEAAFGEYMSKRKCLEEYDRIAEFI